VVRQPTVLRTLHIRTGWGESAKVGEWRIKSKERQDSPMN
jgi:hypothetical protein